MKSTKIRDWNNSLPRRLYVKFLRPLVKETTQHHLRILWFIGGYAPLLFLKEVSFSDRLNLLRRFLVIDWNIIHAHRPSEIADVCKVLAIRRARAGETLLEAGCFTGGSSAKFSIVCKMFGYRLCVFDSFEGVEKMTEAEIKESYDFSGEYAVPEETVRANVEKYGEISVCTFHKGWFKDTLANQTLPFPVRLAFIDCDVAKGTKEALQGVIPALTADGCVFSQDFHIRTVTELLYSPETWASFGKTVPTITILSEKLACIFWDLSL
jgi:O-methyltransferase